MPARGIENFFLVRLGHVARKCFFDGMLCSILLSIVNKETGKKVRFRHKDHFCICIFILTTNLAKMGTLVRTQNIFIAISLVKLNHSHRKYSFTGGYS